MQGKEKNDHSLKFTSKEMNMLYNNGRILYIFYFICIYIVKEKKIKKKKHGLLLLLASIACDSLIIIAVTLQDINNRT